MPHKYFTADNTNGYSSAELDQLNENVEAILHLWQSELETLHYLDDVKNACDLAHNAFPQFPDIA